jgi:hypothetical protein
VILTLYRCSETRAPLIETPDLLQPNL